MPELQEQLQAILGDPQAMGQITAIARALTGGAPPQEPSPPPEQAGDRAFVPVEPSGPEPPPAQTTGLPPSSSTGQVPVLSALMGMLGGDMDPRLLSLAVRLFSEYTAQNDEKAALLAALKPFLRDKRLEKLEKAEKISRLSRVIRVALQILREEGEGHV